MRRTCIGRCPFYTKTSSDVEGLCGLGPSWAQAGDELWILKGAKLPVILRRGQATEQLTKTMLNLETGELSERTIAQGDSVHKIVGECFVLGLMDGQIMELLGDNPSRPRPLQLAEMDLDFRQVDLH